jgi:hypothetical protein
VSQISFASWCTAQVVLCSIQVEHVPRAGDFGCISIPKKVDAALHKIAFEDLLHQKLNGVTNAVLMPYI